jgi:hypothetical protein
MANVDWQSERREQRLDRLCRFYGQSAAIPEASTNFSANMWEAIEARRSSSLFGLVAKLVTSSALAATILFGVLPTSKVPAVEPEYLAVYLEHTQPPSQSELFTAILDSEELK